MATKMRTKFFRVATEGDTTDGREISAMQIEQMARNYDPQKYGARVNLEHMRSLYPDSTFRSYGDVTALKTEKNSEGKLQLLAQIDPTDDLVRMTTKDRQKIYTSIEIVPNFAKTGEAYLRALAVTDNPASLGTEMLKFSAHAKESPLAARKHSPENLFTAAVPITIELDDEPTNTNDEVTVTVKSASPSLIERFTASILGQKPTPTTPPIKTSDCFTHDMMLRAENQAVSQAIEQFSTQMAEAMKPITEAVETLRIDHNALVKKLSSTDATAPRTLATGGKSENITDC